MTDTCPRCGGPTDCDSVDVGVGVIFGPRGCLDCGWSEDPAFDLSNGASPLDSEGGAIDQFGGYHPPGSTTALAYRLAEIAGAGANHVREALPAHHPDAMSEAELLAFARQEVSCAFDKLEEESE